MTDLCLVSVACPYKNGQCTGWRMTAALFCPVSSQKPSLQYTIGKSGPITAFPRTKLASKQ